MTEEAELSFHRWYHPLRRAAVNVVADPAFALPGRIVALALRRTLELLKKFMVTGAADLRDFRLQQMLFPRGVGAVALAALPPRDRFVRCRPPFPRRAHCEIPVAGKAQRGDRLLQHGGIR